MNSITNENQSVRANEQPAPANLAPYLWLSLGLALIAMVVAGIIVFFFTTPTYRATATIQIESQPSSILPVNQVFGEDQRLSGYYATQYEILRSRDLAQQAVALIDWEKYPDFVEYSDDEPESSDAQKHRDRVDKFLDQRVVQPVIPTLVVRIHFESKYPELAEAAANALTQVYIRSGVAVKAELASRATEYMADRLKQLRGRLQESENALQEFREDNNMVAMVGGQSLDETALADNMRRLREARQTTDELSNTYNKIRQADGQMEALQEIPVLFNRNPLLEKTKQAYLQAKADYTQTQSRYGSQHPQREAAQARVEGARDAYEAQLKNEADSVRAQYQIAMQNVKSLEKTVENSREEIQQQSRQGSELQVLQREVDTNQQLYDTLLQEFKKTETEGQFETLRAQVIDPAILPDEKYGPKRIRTIVLAGIGGGLLGLLLAVLVRAVTSRGRYHEA